MRFPIKMLDSKDKMAEKAAASVEPEDSDIPAENTDSRRRKSGVCGGPRPFMIQNESQRRVSTGTESMSCSSQDSEDVITTTSAPFGMQIKRLSSETGSISIASSSASSSSSTHMLDELDELLLAIHGQIVESDARRADILAYEDSYRESKALVRQMAQELVMKIRAHEARLLEEIETRRETMYKKLGLALRNGRDKLDKQIKHMEIMHAEGEAIMSESAQTGQAPDLSPHYTTVVEKLREALEEAENMPGAEVKILPICLSPVRCNTAFACLDAHSQQCVNGATTSSHGICHRRKSMPHSPHKPASYHRGRTSSLQVSNSVGGNMHQLAVATQEFGRGSVERRLSVQHHHHSPRHSAGHYNHSLSTTLTNGDSFHNAECLSESDEDLAKTKLMWVNTTEGALEGQINCPNDVCFLPNGHLVVSDRDNNRLQVFNKEGKYIRCIAEGKIKPRRIAITRDGHIAVTDSKDNLIKVYDTEGSLVSSWGKKRFKQMFKAPCAIACTSRGQFIVSDMERHTVTMHNSDGKLLRHLGGEKGGEAEFHSPSYIAVNPRNNDIIVADNWTHSVQVFDEHGNFKLNAESSNDLKYPNGVSCGADGTIYVALWGTHAVAELSSTGKFGGMVLTRGDHSIYHPAGIAVHGNTLAISEYSDTHSALRFYAMNNPSSSG